MNLSTLSQIEAHITQLSLDEQLWLIARIAQRLRAQLVAQSPSDAQLAAMAADPEIQNELQAIAEEFASAEADGLAPEECLCSVAQCISSIATQCKAANKLGSV